MNTATLYVKIVSSRTFVAVLKEGDTEHVRQTITLPSFKGEYENKETVEYINLMSRSLERCRALLHALFGKTVNPRQLHVKLFIDEVVYDQMDGDTSDYANKLRSFWNYEVKKWAAVELRYGARKPIAVEEVIVKPKRKRVSKKQQVVNELDAVSVTLAA